MVENFGREQLSSGFQSLREPLHSTRRVLQHHENEEKQLVPVPVPLKPHPYKCTLPAGYYFINARVPANHPSYRNRTGGPRPIYPFNSFYKFVVVRALNLRNTPD